MLLATRMESLCTERALEVAQRCEVLRAAGRSIVSLGLGQPDLPTPPHIVEAGRKALADGHHRYALEERDGFALRADAVLRLVTPRTRLLVLDNPGNPTAPSSRRASSPADGLAVSTSGADIRRRATASPVTAGGRWRPGSW